MPVPLCDRAGAGNDRTSLLAPEEAQVGDGAQTPAAGRDDHRATPLTPERRAAAVQRCSRGSGGEDRVADERDVLDTQVLAALQALEQRSQAGLLPHLIRLYLQEVPAYLAGLHEAVAQGDTGRVEEVAHGLRGSSAQLGATRMTSLCTALQEDGRAHNLRRAAARVAALTREFARVQAALEAVRQQAQPPDA